MMLTHWATLSPVSLSVSVVLHGPSVPVLGSDLSYRDRPPLRPRLLFSNFSVVGVVIEEENPTTVFDVPKAHVARPVA